MKIAFLCRSLDKGGAERQLIVLARGLHARGHRVQVITFYPGLLDAEIRDAGIELFCLDKKGRWDQLGFLWRLYRLLRHEQPAVLHGYLPVPNIFTVLMKLLGAAPKMVWGVRASNIDLSNYDWTAKATYRLECALSRLADLIISNSQAGKDYAVRHGFPATRTIVIANGIDTERFQYDAAARKELREAWGAGEGSTVVGMVGRLDPMKGYELFLEAAAEFSRRRGDALFVCVGQGDAGYGRELAALAQRLGVADRVRWLGGGLDTARVYSALDLLASTSHGEGFSNVIGEAMSCGVPCVATDVGDTAFILGACGELVATREPAAVADAWLRCLGRREELPAAAIRGRVVEHFSVAALVANTEHTLHRLAEAG